MESGEQPGEAVATAMFRTLWDALAEQRQDPHSIDNITAMIAGQVRQLMPMDEKASGLFQRFVRKKMPLAGTG